MPEEPYQETKSNGLALIPFVSFVVIYLCAGIVLQTQGVEMAFYQFPSVVAATIAVVIAFMQFHKAGISSNFSTFAKGAGSENIMYMLMIFLLAGAFSSVAGAMGGIDSTVNLGVAYIPAQFITAGVFIIAAFLSLATGTSMGTVGALVPIALGLADKAELNVALVLAACLGGAMFGDNLSMISDTTIASTRTQSVELKDKFRVNFWIALPAAIMVIVLLVIFGAPASPVAAEAGDYNVVKVLPYLVVLVLALVGVNVFVALLAGILSAGLIGIACGDLTALSFATEVWNGNQGMIEVFLLSMLFGGIAELTKRYGGLQWLVDQVNKICRGEKSSQIGIATMTGLVDAATANNTVAIIVTGPIVRDIGNRHRIDPRRVASLMDIASCVMQGLIPYGAQMLLLMSLAEGRVGPLDVMVNNWYLYLLALAAVLSIVVPAYSKLVCKGEWDWEAGAVARYN